MKSYNDPEYVGIFWISRHISSTSTCFIVPVLLFSSHLEHMYLGNTLYGNAYMVLVHQYMLLVLFRGF